MHVTELDQWFEESAAQLEAFRAEESPEAREKRLVESDKVVPIPKVTFDVDVAQINSRERQHDHFRKIMESGKLSDNAPPSEKYPPRELEPKDMIVEKDNGEIAPVTVLPTSEMPHKTIFGYKDPLEGSPAREMTKSLLKGDLLGSFIEQVDGEFVTRIDRGPQEQDNDQTGSPARQGTPQAFHAADRGAEDGSSAKLQIKPQAVDTSFSTEARQ